MKLSFAVAALSAIVFGVSIPPAMAFQTVTSDGYPSATLSTRLSDPDDIIQDMSQRYSGGNSATILHLGNTTVGIIGPGGGYAAGNSPFVADPAMGMVPSKREW